MSLHAIVWQILLVLSLCLCSLPSFLRSLSLCRSGPWCDGFHDSIRYWSGPHGSTDGTRPTITKTRTHAHEYLCIHTSSKQIPHALTRAYTSTQARKHTHTHTNTNTHTHTHTHTHTLAHTPKKTRTRTHTTHEHARTLSRTHTHTHTYSRKHSHSQPRSPALACCACTLTDALSKTNSRTYINCPSQLTWYRSSTRMGEKSSPTNTHTHSKTHMR